MSSVRPNKEYEATGTAIEPQICGFSDWGGAIEAIGFLSP
jgi:hypothetical protein